MDPISIEHRSVTVKSASPSTGPHAQRTAVQNADQQKTRVSSLRSDLKLQPVTVDSTGTPNWILCDSLKTRYFKIGWIEYELLARWQLGDPELIVDSVNNETTLNVSNQDLKKLLDFLDHNELIIADNSSTVNALLAKSERKGPELWRRGFRSTMFARKRLFNPDKLLTLLCNVLSPVFNHPAGFLAVLMLSAVVAAVGVSAHAYEFRDAFNTFMTPSGIALFVTVLIFLNVLHELGHGVVAKRFGCRVSEIGVALIFMLPVAYCDTSDAWRLASRKKRLLINAGGIAAELVVAVIALLFWLVLPDGVPRTIAYFMAVTSALSTLFINLNPCLKFDGYYLLSDWLGVQNMQRKAFDLGRWQWRQRILGDLETVPHPVTKRELKALRRYANFTWAYRFFLYISICAMVYQFWFKALGVTLMIGVCMAMLVKPLASELWHYLKTIASGKVSPIRVGTLCVLLLIGAFVFVPLPRNVQAPAVVSADKAGRVFNHMPGMVEQVNVEVGQRVMAGDVLVQLSVPELDYQEAALKLALDNLKNQFQRDTGWQEKTGHSDISPAHIASKQAELDQVIQQQKRLALRAPFDARAVAVPEWLKPGTWLSANTVLVEFISTENAEIRAYLPANKLVYVDDAQATFESESGAILKNLTLKSVSSSNIDVMSDSLLSTQHGGSIATRQLGNGELSPLQGWHLVTFVPEEDSLKISQEQVGFAKIETQPHSLASSAYRRVYGVVLRESGF